MKNTPRETTPAGVTGESRSKQAGDIRSRWDWVEPVVWTERMLTALEKGVKGGVWFSLMDKVEASRPLEAAWRRVQANRGSGGVDRQTVAQFAQGAEARLAELSRSLKEGTYRPLPVRRVYIPKSDGRRRPLGIPAVRDRIVQAALRNAMEPIFEVTFCEHSYGFRPGRGAKDALRRVNGLLQGGYRHVVDADLKSYFDTIPHDRLMTLVKQRVADGRVLSLVRAFLDQGVLEGMRQWTPIQGTPQGAVISPLLANVYLHPLDVLMRDAGFEMVRYADDFVVLCRTAEDAQRALERIQSWVQEAGLTLHPEKTRIVSLDAGDGFDFLGYHFESKGRRWPRRSSLKKFRDVIRRKTRRTNGRCMKAIITDLNPMLRGWYGYFQHSHHTTFNYLDGWIRMRLRSILRKRQGRRGRGRGQDHQRWPNAYFARQGLYSLYMSFAQKCQPQRAH